MFFEDEKENIEDYNSLDEFDINLDEDIDDETISWDDLLKDDSVLPSDSYSLKPAVQSEPVKPLNVTTEKEIKEENTQESISDEIDDLYQETSVDELSDNVVENEAKKDAFEVFGGDVKDDTIEADDILDDENQSILDELDDVEASDNLDELSQDETQEASNDDSVSVSQGQKRGLDIPVIAGIVFAAVLVLGSIVFIFMGPKNSASNQDVVVNNMPQQNQTVVTDEQINKNVNLPAGEGENIPVVNDKSAKKLQPEKKVVVDVESAGRVNPFLPTFDGFNGNYYAGIPTQSLVPPDSFGDDQDAQELMRVSVSGILFDNVKPSAIITINDVDYFVQKGDTVDDYNVIDINRQSVVVKKGTNIYKAGVGERFNQKIEIDGSAVYGSGGVRHYTSASDVEVVAK